MQNERHCGVAMRLQPVRGGEAVFSMLCETVMANARVTIGEETRIKTWRHKHAVEIDTQSKCRRASVLASANHPAELGTRRTNQANDCQLYP
jgi:hypothetical protein